VPRAEVEAALAPYYRMPPADAGAGDRSPKGERAPDWSGKGGSVAGSGVAASGELRIPGPFAIAHQLIKAWALGDMPPAAPSPKL
jgi:hypothetical protein